MPNHKNPWSEPPDHGIGRSRGGLTTKLHLVCDGRGRPLSMMITAGNINDTTMMSAVLENIRVPRDGKGRPRTRPDRVLADKGYPSRANRAWLRDRRIAATIPERDDQIAHRRKKPGRPIAFGDKQKERYKGRNVVERCFNRLKQWRGIAMRSDKLASRRQQPRRGADLDQDRSPLSASRSCSVRSSCPTVGAPAKPRSVR
ncbi:IS5 family transposase [Microbacterium gawkjiense]|uniref:IS5 family transposase n=1 Tax=Microbacterium gawkjiense TaxID=3067309 RepID=UPI003BF549EE